MTNGVNVLKVLLVPSIIPIGISWVTTFSNFRYPASFVNSEILSPLRKAEFITDSKAGEILIILSSVPVITRLPSEFIIEFIATPSSFSGKGFPDLSVTYN